MELSGTVHNGVVIFDGGESLPEGTRVTVAEQAPPAPTTHFELFRDIIGRARGCSQSMESFPNTLPRRNAISAPNKRKPGLGSSKK